MPRKPNHRALLSDRELLDTILRDTRAIYVDVVKRPLPIDLAAALVRLECRSVVAADEKPRTGSGGRRGRV
jgi:hypothetical protein